MSGNKENMRQAMKELLGLVGFGPEEKETAVDMEATQQEVAETVDKGFFRPSEPKTAPVEKSGGFFRPAAPQTAPEPVAKAPEEAEGPLDSLELDDMTDGVPFIRPGATVISAGASLFGDIRADGDVEVLGKLKGNLEATGNVRVCGKVLGDVKGDSVQLCGCAIQGNITATAAVELDETAMVVGDILATDISSDGKVKGNLQIARTASFQSKAVLAGNVTAGTIAMSQGARIQGTMRISEDPETNSLFGEGLEI